MSCVLEKPKYFKYNGELVSLETPIVMGIINITDDSFYKDSRYRELDSILMRVEQIIEEGGSIVDIGAYSSRPGSQFPDFVHEKSKLLPALIEIRKNFPEIIISVDSFNSKIFRTIYDHIGEVIVNDITAGSQDPTLFDTVAELKLPYILMHMQGTPETMQENPDYKNIVKDILIIFSRQIQILKEKGIKDIIIDPGFGFGKTINHNYQLLNHFSDFTITELPLLAGVSRKSMIYKHLDISPE
ncbi:MAG: dihydropteroate synthase [Marinilabiliales bacterium]|nr:MAG: dihydropteroate synthase [Marinilabiliales bacterium]